MESPGRMTLWGIEVFVAAVEEGSISGAARRVEASPSTVSQQITNLEAALGARLMDRNTRPLELTPAGRLFLRRAMAMLAEAEAARSELAVNDYSRLARVRLGVIEDFDADVTPRLLVELGDELRSCQFLLETGYSLALTEALGARRLDMAIAADLGQPEPWMDIHPLLAEPFVLAVRKGSLNDREPVVSQLLRRPYIRYSTRQIMGRQIDRHLATQGIEIPYRYEMDSYHAILALVAAGVGWTITTPLGYMRAHRFRDRVDLAALPFAPLSRSISLAARRGTLAGMPAHIAAIARRLLAELVVEAAVTRVPWLEGALKVLEPMPPTGPDAGDGNAGGGGPAAAPASAQGGG